MIFSRVYGKGTPLVIIHGLFGMSDNWNTLGKRFAEKFNVHIVDLRNHGRSFHSNDFSYNLMAEDIEKYIHSLNLDNPIIIGHSLGGKVGMNLAFRNNIKFRKLIVVDIAPKKYSVDFHKNILEFLSSISIKELKVLLSQSSKEMLLIDVRNQNEYNQSSITGSLLIPLSSIESGKAIDEIKILTAKKNLYVFCKSGKRSLLALKHLNKFGIRGINILGGIDAWNSEKN